MRSYRALIGIAATLATLLLLGCSSDNQVTAPEPEAQLSLPPASTMTMDLGFFQPAQIDSQAISTGRLAEPQSASTAALKLNYLNAAVRVFFLNVVTYAALAQPVAVFATAIHSVPQHQEDGSWLWTYVYVDEHGSEYSVFLRGKRGDSTVAWSMEVSSNDPALLLDHFLWFAGEVKYDERAGYWQFYEPDSSAVTTLAGSQESTAGIQTVRIDWRNNGRDDQRLALLINKPGDPEEGSTLVFDQGAEMSMVEFHSVPNANTGTITWYPDGSGSIEWPDYNDGVKGCWDQSQNDIDCQ